MLNLLLSLSHQLFPVSPAGHVSTSSVSVTDRRCRSYRAVLPVADNLLQIGGGVKQEMLPPFIPVYRHGAVHVNAARTRGEELSSLLQNLHLLTNHPKSNVHDLNRNTDADTQHANSHKEGC